MPYLLIIHVCLPNAETVHLFLLFPSQQYLQLNRQGSSLFRNSLDSFFFILSLLRLNTLPHPISPCAETCIDICFFFSFRLVSSFFLSFRHNSSLQYRSGESYELFCNIKQLLQYQTGTYTYKRGHALMRQISFWRSKNKQKKSAHGFFLGHSFLPLKGYDAYGPGLRFIENDASG